MKIYAMFDNKGLPIGFWDNNIYPDEYTIDGAFIKKNKEIPNQAVEITEEQHLEFINNSGKKVWNNGKVITLNMPFIKEKAIKQAKMQVVTFADEITSKILSQYPKAEQKLWPDFRKEAISFDQNAVANNAVADFPVLTKMLESKLGAAADDNETLARLAAAVPSILANAAGWSAIAEYVAGLRARIFAQLDVATNQADIEAILTTAKTEAYAVAQQYGLM